MTTARQEAYLVAGTMIDWQTPEILAKAHALARGAEEVEIVRRCFEFVRDQVSHSMDAGENPVTCKASDVLRHATGYCYAKSHLLAALLRANAIPAGLCYQRLSVNDNGAPYCLHGLNAVWLDGHGWYRLDSRGNRDGIDAQFSPPAECLAYAIKDPHEADLPEIWAEPLPAVVRTLTFFKTVEEVGENLPDVELVLHLNGKAKIQA